MLLIRANHRTNKFVCWYDRRNKYVLSRLCQIILFENNGYGQCHHLKFVVTTTTTVHTSQINFLYSMSKNEGILDAYHVGGHMRVHQIMKIGLAFLCYLTCLF